MACFHDRPIIVDFEGRRIEDAESVRRFSELLSSIANDARAMAESLFHGTRSRNATPIKAMGVELFELMGGRIKEIRDYHRLVQ
jgi:hypothetical protein